MLTRSFEGVVTMNAVESIGEIDLQQDRVLAMTRDKGACYMDGCLSSDSNAKS